MKKNIIRKTSVQKIAKAGFSGYKYVKNVRLAEQLSLYQKEFKAKQAIKHFYGDLTDKTYKNLKNISNVSLTDLMVNVEKRLDVVLYRFGHSKSILESRNLIRGGLVKINGKEICKKAYGLVVPVGSEVSVTQNPASEMAKLSRLKLYVTPNPSHLIKKVSKLNNKKNVVDNRFKGFVIKKPIDSQIYTPAYVSNSINK